MEKWRCRPKSLNKIEIETTVNEGKKSKSKRWTISNLFKRNLKQESLSENIYINDNVSKINQSNKVESSSQLNDKHKNKMNLSNGLKIKNENISSDTMLNNINRRYGKSRIYYSKKYKYDDNNSSSDDNNIKSNSSLSKIIHNSDDNIQKYELNRKTRGARNERYFKRLYREDLNNIFDTNRCNNSILINKKKYSSDTLLPSSTILTTKGNVLISRDKKLLYENYQSSLPSCHTRQNNSYLNKSQQFVDTNERIYNGNHNKQMNSNKSVEENIYVNVNPHNRIRPPEPPPRSTSMRLSFQSSDVDDEIPPKRISKLYHNVNYNSLDGFYCNKSKYIKPNFKDHCDDDDNNNNTVKEEPIVPTINDHKTICKQYNFCDNNKKDSKNLEEALIELEKIYNSLQLNDEDLLDRAEKRSMDEYREKITSTAAATELSLEHLMEGSIKSSSDRSSSSRELEWRVKSFDRCQENDMRLKDDMAYRRMHQNERPTSLDINQTSLSKISYLNLSTNDVNNDNDDYKNKNRRATPDLTKDDVLYRSINHANNTLKIMDPQPPFGIPLGPVTSAPQTDYLHSQPTKQFNSRSLYIPQSEPNVVTDDLAFRSLRKDFYKTNSEGTNQFIQKRPVRSLSADLYKIISKRNDNQYTWYKEYVKCNKSYTDNDDNDDDDEDNNPFDKQLDINGNPHQNIYQSKIQVFIPQQIDDRRDKERQDEEEKLRNDLIRLSPSFDGKNKVHDDDDDDEELSEYKQLCQELESLIKKTSEKVKITCRNDQVFHKNVDDDDVELCWSQPDEKLSDNLNEQQDLAIINRENDKVVEELNNVPCESIDANIDSDIKCNNSNDNNNNNNDDDDDDNLIEKGNLSRDMKKTCRIGNNVSTYEGEEIENKFPVIMHETICFITNCLSSYSVTVWSLCLTLIIAIIFNK